MTAKPKKPGKGGKKSSPAGQEKAAFKEDLAARIESEHESVQFDAGITVGKIEQSLGVGNLKVYFDEVENNFANSKILTSNLKEEAKLSTIKIKKISSSRPKKRRKQRGKIGK